MIYFKVSTLKELCLIKTVTSLWNPNDLQDFKSDIKTILLTISSDYRGGNKDWCNIETKVHDKTSTLPLPDILKKEICDYIKPVGEELLSWLYQNHFQFKYTGVIPEKIYWTGGGTIDKTKTARALMTDESLSTLERYRLALFYCLEDFIYFFKSQLTNDQIADFNKKSLDYPVSFRSSRRKNDLFNIKGSYCAAFDFEKSVTSGNATACEYFMEKLNQDTKQKMLLESVCIILEKSSQIRHNIIKKPYEDVIRFLFIHMTEEQQIKWCNHKTEIWTCFINSHRQTPSPNKFSLLDYISLNDAYTHLFNSCLSQIDVENYVIKIMGRKPIKQIY